MTHITRSNKKPLTGEERAKLLAKVYAVILSPEWDKDYSRSPQLPGQNEPAELEKLIPK